MRKIFSAWPYLAIMAVVCLFFPVRGFAQGGEYQSITFGPMGLPKGGVTVTVCAPSSPVVANVCTTPEVDANCCFTDGGLGTHVANPFPSDGLGNVTFWAAPGKYQVSYSGAGVTAVTQTVGIGCVPGGTGCTGLGAQLNAANTFTAPQSVVNPGVFTNTQMNLYATSLINNCSPLAEFQAAQTTANFSSDGFTGCLSLPVSSSVHQGNGGAFYANTFANSSGRTVNNVAGVYMSARVLGNGGAGWGGNCLVQDANGITNGNLTCLEADVNIVGTPSYVRSFLSEICTTCVAGWTGTVPGTATAYEINHIGVAQWPFGVFFTRGTFSNAAMVMDGLNSTAGTSSNRIAFRGYDGGNVLHEASILADQNGNLQLQSSVGSAVYVKNTGMLQLPANAFSTYTACGAGLEGSQASITDSTTSTWGATITGGGANHVMGYCDGTNWTVTAK
jgi:hypothetical protein